MDKKAFDEFINNINDKIFKSTFQQKEINYLYFWSRKAILAVQKLRSF